jgi:WD40 repeat protein
MTDFVLEKFRQKNQHRDKIVRMRFSPTGQYLVSADISGEILLRTKDNFQNPKRIIHSSPDLTDVWFSEDEKLLLVGHIKGFLQVYELPKARIAGETHIKPDISNRSTVLSGTSRSVLDYIIMAICPVNSQFIHIALEFRDFFTISRNSLEVVKKIHYSGNIIEQTTASPDGGYIFFGDDLGFIYRYDLKEMNMAIAAEHHELVDAYDSSMKPTIKDYASGIAALALSGDCSLLATSSYEGGLQIWETTAFDVPVSNLRSVMPFASKAPHGKGRIRGLSFYPGTKSVFAGSDDGTLIIWDYQTNQIVYNAKCSDGVRSIDVSRVDHQCAVGCKDGSMYIFPGILDPLQTHQKNQSSWFRRLF